MWNLGCRVCVQHGGGMEHVLDMVARVLYSFIYLFILFIIIFLMTNMAGT